MSALLEVKNLNVSFDMKRGFLDTLLGRNKAAVKAVDDVSFDIGRGEILALVGESGSGKTTSGRAILNLVPRNGGSVLFDGAEVSGSGGAREADFRRRAQMIFQDPYQSLNPKDMVADIVGEPLVINRLEPDAGKRLARVTEALEFAGLKPAENFLYRYPYELSGGQRQRVAIASVFVLSPDFIVADEPVSMLDASVRADILSLMVRMRDEKNTSYLFITHDLSLAWLIADRVAILYLGKIMEIGGYGLLSGSCAHPYTKALLKALPVLEGGAEDSGPPLSGEIPSPTRMPKGCRFHPRCPYVRDICREADPELRELGPGHRAACHFAGELT